MAVQEADREAPSRTGDKAPNAFRTISEVAEELDLPQHVLRFWETRFSQIKPLKRGGGRRYYRPDDIELLRGIRYLLYGRGYTIKGVQKILREKGLRHVQSIEAGEAAALAPEPEWGRAGEAAGDLGADGADAVSVEAPPETVLAPSDLERLRAVLADLVECRRVLAAARSEGEGAAPE